MSKGADALAETLLFDALRDAFGAVLGPSEGARVLGNIQGRIRATAKATGKLRSQAVYYSTVVTGSGVAITTLARLISPDTFSQIWSSILSHLPSLYSSFALIFMGVVSALLLLFVFSSRISKAGTTALQYVKPLPAVLGKTALKLTKGVVINAGKLLYFLTANGIKHANDALQYFFPAQMRYAAQTIRVVAMTAVRSTLTITFFNILGLGSKYSLSNALMSLFGAISGGLTLYKMFDRLAEPARLVQQAWKMSRMATALIIAASMAYGACQLYFLEFNSQTNVLFPVQLFAASLGQLDVSSETIIDAQYNNPRHFMETWGTFITSIVGTLLGIVDTAFAVCIHPAVASMICYSMSSLETLKILITQKRLELWHIITKLYMPLIGLCSLVFYMQQVESLRPLACNEVVRTLLTALLSSFSVSSLQRVFKQYAFGVLITTSIHSAIKYILSLFPAGMAPQQAGSIRDEDASKVIKRVFSSFSSIVGNVGAGIKPRLASLASDLPDISQLYDYLPFSHPWPTGDPGEPHLHLNASNSSSPAQPIGNSSDAPTVPETAMVKTTTAISTGMTFSISDIYSNTLDGLGNMLCDVTGFWCDRPVEMQMLRENSIRIVGCTNATETSLQYTLFFIEDRDADVEGIGHYMLMSDDGNRAFQVSPNNVIMDQHSMNNHSVYNKETKQKWERMLDKTTIKFSKNLLVFNNASELEHLVGRAVAETQLTLLACDAPATPALAVINEDKVSHLIYDMRQESCFVGFRKSPFLILDVLNNTAHTFNPSPDDGLHIIQSCIEKVKTHKQDPGRDYYIPINIPVHTRDGKFEISGHPFEHSDALLHNTIQFSELQKYGHITTPTNPSNSVGLDLYKVPLHNAKVDSVFGYIMSGDAVAEILLELHGRITVLGKSVNYIGIGADGSISSVYTNKEPESQKLMSAAHVMKRRQQEDPENDNRLLSNKITFPGQSTQLLGDLIDPLLTGKRYGIRNADAATIKGAKERNEILTFRIDEIDPYVEKIDVMCDNDYCMFHNIPEISKTVLSPQNPSQPNPEKLPTATNDTVDSPPQDNGNSADYVTTNGTSHAQHSDDDDGEVVDADDEEPDTETTNGTSARAAVGNGKTDEVDAEVADLAYELFGLSI